MPKSSSKTQPSGSVHDSIFESSAKEEPTMNQCKYLIYLYKAKIQSKILKRHKFLQNAKTKDFPFFAMANRKAGSFAIHFLNTFSVNENLNRGAVSQLINNAKLNNKFDLKLIARFCDSANAYYQAKADS
jgi:hypothetical protein|tara:strand:+ start:355 stop:744 length:390 start_codon:yes stop_codon:yes gene_type:complete